VLEIAQEGRREEISGFPVLGADGSRWAAFPFSAAATGGQQRNLFGCLDCGLLPGRGSFRGRFRLCDKLKILRGKFELRFLLPVMDIAWTKRDPPGYEHQGALAHKRRELLRPLLLLLKDGPPWCRLLLSRNNADSEAKLAKGFLRYRLLNIFDPPYTVNTNICICKSFDGHICLLWRNIIIKLG